MGYQSMRQPVELKHGGGAAEVRGKKTKERRAEQGIRICTKRESFLGTGEKLEGHQIEVLVHDVKRFQTRGELSTVASKQDWEGSGKQMLGPLLEGGEG